MSSETITKTHKLFFSGAKKSPPDHVECPNANITTCPLVVLSRVSHVCACQGWNSVPADRGCPAPQCPHPCTLPLHPLSPSGCVPALPEECCLPLFACASAAGGNSTKPKPRWPQSAHCLVVGFLSSQSVPAAPAVKPDTEISGFPAEAIGKRK